jgi:hypothetical protein
MRLKFFVLALPALLALVLVASGCGGGGSSSTTTAKKPAKETETASKLSKGQFISQGDAICGEVNTAVGSVGESAAEPAAQLAQVANLYSGMVQSLQRLGQPSEIDGYTEFMGAAEKLAAAENEVKSASEAENPALVEEASQGTGPAVEEFEQQAAIYGFKECSEGPHAPVAAPESGGVTPEEEFVPEEESGGIEVAPEEEEFIPEEEVAPEEEEFVPEEEVAPETGGAGGEIEEAPEEVAPETGGESGGIGPG